MASSNKISYHVRLFLWLVGYSLLLVICFILFQYHREKEFKASELNAGLQLINSYILDDLARGAEPSTILHDHPQPFGEVRISIIDSNGRVVYDNTLDSIPDANHLSRHEIARAMSTGSGYTLRRHSQSTGNTYFYSATLGRDGCIVRTAVPYSVSLSELLKADYGFLWIMGAVTLAMCVLGFFATRRVGLHITRLNTFARKAESGQPIQDTAPFPDDELGSISNHIVRLYASLQRATADRDREHKAALHQQQEKERIKKQLTNNINHELKTPVTSIQVCVETLINHPDLPEDKRIDFLQRCLAGTDRLKRLLDDVSLITRMDEAPATIMKEPVNLTDIILATVDEHREIARRHGMTIDCTLDDTMPLTGNPALLESVFSNLIDNAIAYSGGDLISIHGGAETGHRYIITVTDNGSGIPSRHLPHIFERFYRIDKGRSRAAGGTGLGLSIVKNAVMIHGGTISAGNRPGGGLKFTITFPADGQSGSIHID